MASSKSPVWIFALTENSYSSSSSAYLCCFKVARFWHFYLIVIIKESAGPVRDPEWTFRLVEAGQVVVGDFGYKILQVPLAVFRGVLHSIVNIHHSVRLNKSRPPKRAFLVILSALNFVDMRRFGLLKLGSLMKFLLGLSTTR